MRAITVTPGVAGLAELAELEPPRPDGELLVEMLALGVCGTDREILDGQYGWAPHSRSTLRRARYDQTMKHAHVARATNRAIQNCAWRMSAATEPSSMISVTIVMQAITVVDTINAETTCARVRKEYMWPPGQERNVGAAIL